jgi:hypothetical protein
MSHRPPQPEDEDLDLGEPVTETLEVLLEALPDDGSWSAEDEVDLGEPVTDRLRALLAELPEGTSWEGDEDPDWDEPVTDRLDVLLSNLPAGSEAGGEKEPGEGFWSRVRRALFDRRRKAGGGAQSRSDED